MSQIPAPRLVPVGELHPWDDNPRTITAERLKNLRRAIAADPDFLHLRPILARSDGLIYCGNQRYLAAVANGATAVPAVLEDVDERTMRERAIRDNEGERLLIVEDAPDDAELIAASASANGLRSEIVATAAAARDAILRDPPTAVVLDLRLPDARGEGLLEWIKTQDRTRRIPSSS